jgi:hypothetical protein
MPSIIQTMALAASLFYKSVNNRLTIEQPLTLYGFAVLVFVTLFAKLARILTL